MKRPRVKSAPRRTDRNQIAFGKNHIDDDFALLQLDAHRARRGQIGKWPTLADGFAGGRVPGAVRIEELIERVDVALFEGGKGAAHKGFLALDRGDLRGKRESGRSCKKHEEK